MTESNLESLSIDEIKFKRRYIQERLLELKVERETLIERKASLEALLANHRAARTGRKGTVQGSDGPVSPPV